MKRLLLLLPALLALTTWHLEAQMSVGNYRIPYSSGVAVTALLDHVTHPLTNRVDLRSLGTNTPYAIRAAADGTVRFIRDNGTGTNYVWIEHSNGEWTGYFYLQNNSVPASLSNGSPVTAGQQIGSEGAVGSPGGLRVRFEVGVPFNPNDAIVTSTGMIKGSSRIPVICNIPDNVLRQGVRGGYTADVCTAFEFTYGTYRLPYSNNVTFKVNNDHLTHSPDKARYDLGGQSGGSGGTFPIVAAAAGTVMIIVDTNTTNCSSCSAFNNYLWLRHSNGEWSKYTHFMTGSITTNAGLTVGSNVVAGQYLGNEGQVGAASGDHLHFEVGVPDDPSTVPNAIQISGGFLKGRNRIPLFCGVPGNLLFEDDVVTGANCSGGSCTNDLVVPAKIIRGTEAYVAADTVDTDNNNISLDTYASLALIGGNKVTLRPGFKALTGSYLRAATQPCVNPP